MKDFFNIRRFLLLLHVFLLGAAAYAQSPQIRRIDVNCVLDSTGCAHITEVWDVCVASGTEWYLVRTNLGEIELKNLTVKEGGTVFQVLQDWDVNATIAQKKEKCGLNSVPGGYEICWGVGSYGDHVFTVSYDMTNAVKSLTDYDMLHLQFISDQLSSAPQLARIRVSAESAALDEDNAAVWGFGFEGYAGFAQGEIRAVADGGLKYDDSMILLIRLDKGIISNPSCVWDEEFQISLDTAMEGSDWDDEPKTFREKVIRALSKIFDFILSYSWAALIVAYLYLSDFIDMWKFLGARKKSVTWCRDIPFDGDLCTTEFALGKIYEGCLNNVASAMILQMIQLGALEVSGPADDAGNVNLVFGDRSRLDGLPEPVGKLWDILYEASGDNRILEDKEFSKWAQENRKRVSKWVDTVDKTGEDAFVKGGYGTRTMAYGAGRIEIQKALGLKKFLLDFTLIKERVSYEVVLWKQYMVFGALFGVADKVAEELKNIAPEHYVESAGSSHMYSTISMTSSLGGSITSARRSYMASSGGGGRSSRGGGGGFSGGGHGGGSR